MSSLRDVPQYLRDIFKRHIQSCSEFETRTLPHSRVERSEVGRANGPKLAARTVRSWPMSAARWQYKTPPIAASPLSRPRLFVDLQPCLSRSRGQLAPDILLRSFECERTTFVSRVIILHFIADVGREIIRDIKVEEIPSRTSPLPRACMRARVHSCASAGVKPSFQSRASDSRKCPPRRIVSLV